MSSDGLKKVYLIKSAGFEFTEVDVSKNTLLLGESGVGKTTIMRAVLFFYTMDYSDSMLNLTSDTKKSFNDWYFKEYNSHIVYEYERAESRFLFVVSKSGKLHYTFIDITNSLLEVKDIFIDENIPVNLEELNEKIQKENLPNYSTTIKDKYISAFHKRDINNKKIKQESIVDFSLYENISFTKEFAKTLSNIFTSSKVDSSSIKKSIVSLIENSDAKIDLSEIRINLDEYVSHKDEIEQFEKKTPEIEKLADKFNEYSANRKEFKVMANRVYAIKQKVSMKMEEINIDIKVIEDEKNVLKNEFVISMKKKDGEIELKTKEVYREETELKSLKQKDKEYKEKNIEILVAEFTKEEEYKKQEKNSIERYTALTSEFESLNKKYKNIIENLKKEAETEILNLKNLNLESIKNISTNKTILIEGKEEKIEKNTQKYRDEKKSLVLQLEEENNIFNKGNVELAKVEFFPFNKEEINRYEDEIKEYEKFLATTNLSQANNKIEIEQVEKEIQEVSETLKKSNKELDEKVKLQKEKLFAQKEDFEKKLDFQKSNLYGYLNKHNIKNRKKIVTYLKDEILFSDKSFKVIENEENDSIFGLNLEFDKEFENDYEQSKLLNGLKLVKDSIKTLNKDTMRKKQDLEKEASKLTIVKNRYRATLYKTKDDLEIEQNSYTQGIKRANISLDNAKQVAIKQKKQKTDELQFNFINSKRRKIEISSEIETLEKEIETVISSINEAVKKSLLDLDKQLELLENSEKAKVEEIRNECNFQIETINLELLDALNNQGVDSELLESISTEISTIQTRLNKINKTKAIVFVYLSEYKDKIQTIPSLEVNLRENSKLLEDLKEKKKQFKSNNKLKEELLQTKIETLQRVKSDIGSFIKSYKEKIENDNIEKKVQESLVLDTYVLNENLLINSTVVDSIVKIYNDIKLGQESIETAVLKIIKNLKIDNIFKIEIPNDFVSNSSYLKTANELIEYIKNDKLSYFKDASLEKFKSNINYIKKQLNVFEEALLDIDSEVKNLKNGIKKATGSFKVIDDIDIKYEDSNSNVLNTLKSLSNFYDENNDKFLSGLFDSFSDDKTSQRVRGELRDKIVELVKLLNISKEYLELENGFVIEFKVVERGNSLAWRQTINDIGSNGTSTLVKSIINISMLKMVSKNIVKNSEIVTHCILDEIGTISTEYFKELKDFVNRSGFVFLNGMPTEDDMLISMYPNIYVGQNFGKYSKMIFASKMES